MPQQSFSSEEISGASPFTFRLGHDDAVECVARPFFIERGSGHIRERQFAQAKSDLMPQFAECLYRAAVSCQSRASTQARPAPWAETSRSALCISFAASRPMRPRLEQGGSRVGVEISIHAVRRALRAFALPDADAALAGFASGPSLRVPLLFPFAHLAGLPGIVVDIRAGSNNVHRRHPAQLRGACSATSRTLRPFVRDPDLLPVEGLIDEIEELLPELSDGDFP